MLKDKNWLRLLHITWKLLISFCAIFSAFLLISIIVAIYYLTAKPPEMACFMCVGCPCAYTEFITARDYYLNVLFPRLIVLNSIIISFCATSIVILKLRFEDVMLRTINKT